MPPSTLAPAPMSRQPWRRSARSLLGHAHEIVDRHLGVPDGRSADFGAGLAQAADGKAFAATLEDLPPQRDHESTLQVRLDRVGAPLPGLARVKTRFPHATDS